MTTFDPHPIRVWQNDKNMGPKLDALSQYQRESRKKYGPPLNGIQLIAMPVAPPIGSQDSFKDLQAGLYMQQRETQFLTQFQMYWDKSRQMFSFAPSIAKALSLTDVDDVPWDALLLPHEDFHVTWGDFGQETFSIRDSRYVIDGAYVRRVPQESELFPNDTILIQFTSQLTYPTYGKARRAKAIQDMYFSDPVYDYAISGANAPTIGKAIENGEEEYSQYCQTADKQLHKFSVEFALDEGVEPDSNIIHPFAGKFERSRAIVRQSVPLLFNVIFYLTQKPEGRELKFPTGAPRGQINRLALEKSEKNKASISSSLARKGFSEITFIRDADASTEEKGSKTEKTLRSHWRRGHWRHHRYGKELASRKWIWIKPVLVKKSDDFEIGTLHRVKPEETEN